MALATEFEDLMIWKQARKQVNQVYDLFRRCPDASFRNQIERAAISVMNNVAEGFERESRKDFSNFLRIAKASCGEVRSMLYLAEDRSFVAPEQATSARAFARQLSKSIAAFRRTL